MAEKDSVTAEKYFISAIYLCVGVILHVKYGHCIWGIGSRCYNTINNRSVLAV